MSSLQFYWLSLRLEKVFPPFSIVWWFIVLRPWTVWLTQFPGNVHEMDFNPKCSISALRENKLFACKFYSTLCFPLLILFSREVQSIHHSLLTMPFFFSFAIAVYTLSFAAVRLYFTGITDGWSEKTTPDGLRRHCVPVCAHRKKNAISISINCL